MRNPASYLRGLARNATSSETTRNVLTLVVASGIAQLVFVATIPIISRLYTPAQYGAYSLFLSLSTVLSVVAAWRYEVAIVLSDSLPDAIGLRRLSTAIGVGMCGLVTIAVVISFAAGVELPGLEGSGRWAWFLGLSVFLLSQASVVSHWLTREKIYFSQGVSRIAKNIVISAVQIALGLTILSDTGGLILGLVLGQAAAVVALVIGDRISSTRQSLSLPGVVSPLLGVLRKYRRIPLFNAPTAVLDAIRTNGIVIIIGAASIATLGQFSLAWTMLQAPLALVGAALTQVFYQKMASVTPAELPAIVKTTITRTALLSAVPFVAVMVWSPWLFVVVFGPQWQQAGVFGQILVPWAYVNLVSAPIANALLVIGKTQYLFYFAIPYTVVPLLVLALTRGEPVLSIAVLSGVMTLFLSAFLVITLRAVRTYATLGIQKTDR